LFRAFISSSIRVCLAFQMSTTVEKPSCKWHREQEKLFVRLTSKSGGEGVVLLTASLPQDKQQYMQQQRFGPCFLIFILRLALSSG
jgi:hypothetical protein